MDEKVTHVCVKCLCSVDEEPSDDQILQAAAEARRLAVDAELCDDCTQQPLIAASLHRCCHSCHQVSSHSFHAHVSFMNR